MPKISWVYHCQLKWYGLVSKYKPLSALAYLKGFELRFDGHFWWVNETAYELLYFARGPWWFFKLKNCSTGKKEAFRILFSQLSKRDHWQLSVLFRLYRF